MPMIDGRKGLHSELSGEIPQLATVESVKGRSLSDNGRDHAVSNSYSRLNRVQHKINLKSVAEALLDEGLDPAVEIARMLRGEVKVNAETGEIETDPLTGEPLREYLIDEEIRLRTFNSLLEFCQPKLKAMEVKVTNNDLSSEQLDDRIKTLLAKTIS